MKRRLIPYFLLFSVTFCHLSPKQLPHLLNCYRSTVSCLDLGWRGKRRQRGEKKRARMREGREGERTREEKETGRREKRSQNRREKVTV